MIETKHTSLKNIHLSHFNLDRGPQFVVSLRDRWRDIYSEKGLLLAAYLLPGASVCQRLHPLASRIWNILIFDPAVNRETGASGRRYHIDMWTGWIRCRYDVHKKQVESNNYISRCHRQFELVGISSVEVRVAVRGSENQLPAEGLGPQDPRLSSPAEWERSASIVRGTRGQYVAVCSVSNSPLTHNLFATLSNKVERYIFLKMCVRSSLSLIMFPHIYDSVYSCMYIMWLYNILSETKLTPLISCLSRAWLSI